MDNQRLSFPGFIKQNALWQICLLFFALMCCFLNPQVQAQETQKSQDEYSSDAFKIQPYGGVRTGFALGSGHPDWVADTYLGVDADYITEHGLLFSFNLELRAQKDHGRLGFGGRAGTCPPGAEDCASGFYAGHLRSVAGYTGGFFGAAPREHSKYRGSLESAYVFMQTPYGSFSAGREKGAAQKFSTYIPSMFVLTKAADAPTDYTGLAGVKVKNDTSGFAEKFSYISPRLLGLQWGISYTPRVQVCGVDFCIRSSSPLSYQTPLTPGLKNIVETGLSFDHTLQNGLRIELMMNYAHGKKNLPVKGFHDFTAAGAGASLQYKGFTLGASFLDSNNGWSRSGKYQAYDFGLAYERGKWGVSFEYGGSSDSLAHIDTKAAQAGISFRFLDRFSLGGGIQHLFRNEPKITPEGRRGKDKEATVVFIEGGFDF